MRQGTATNKLTKIKSDTNSVKLDQITGKATIQRGDFSISFENWPEITGLERQRINYLMLS